MALNQIIIEKETALLNAFQNKDLHVLEELIHDDAVFVLPNGMTVTKPMVIDNYRTGNTAMTEISGSDQLITVIDDTAVVAFTLHLKGNSLGNSIDAKFRYIRVWKKTGKDWKAIAVSGVPLPDQK